MVVGTLGLLPRISSIFVSAVDTSDFELLTKQEMMGSSPSDSSSFLISSSHTVSTLFDPSSHECDRSRPWYMDAYIDLVQSSSL